MTNPTRSLVFLLAAISLSFQSTACKKRSNQDGGNEIVNSADLKPVKNDWTFLWLSANPVTLNPVLKTDASSSEIVSYLFDSLISFRSDTAEPEGRLAEKWEVSKDGLIYDFYLKKDLKFHDGKPITAEDVKFSFDITRDPKVDAAHLQNYYASLDQVEVMKSDHVRFKMKSVYYRNLIMLGLRDIMPKHVYGKGDFNTLEANRQPVGSGPYLLSKWENGRTIELQRWTDWWGTKDPLWKDRYNYNRIVFRIITEPNVALMALKKGEIDGMEPTPAQWMNDLSDPQIDKKFHKLTYETMDGNGYSYIGWNGKRPKFMDTKVRIALAHLMPRDEINKKIFGGMRKLAVGDAPRNSPKSDPTLQPILYDVEKAKTLLTEAGWKDSNNDGVIDKDGQKFVFELLLGQGSSENERIALIYRESLKQAGIDMTIRPLEWSVYIKAINEDKFDAMMISWTAAFDMDPYQIWHSSQAVKGGSNRVAYKNARVDELLEKARITLDRDERNKLYQEFSRIVSADAPYLFMFERPSLLVVSKRFQGIFPIGKLGVDSSQWFTPMGHEKYKDAAATTSTPGE